MNSWSRLKQATRETIKPAAKDQRTEIPNDVNTLMLKGEAVEKLYKDLNEKTTAFFPETKLKTKNADDPIKGQPLYQLSDVFDAMSSEYHADPAVHQFMVAASCSMSNLARYKAELDQKAIEVFVEPRRQLLRSRIKESDKHYESLKQRRLDLDAMKHKLKSERKSSSSTDTKLHKYETEVQAAQAKFDAEADAIRDLLAVVANDQEMGQMQCRNSANLLLAMKDYFYQSFQALDELDKAVNFNSMEQYSGDSSAVRMPAAVPRVTSSTNIGGLAMKSGSPHLSPVTSPINPRVQLPSTTSSFGARPVPMTSPPVVAPKPKIAVLEPAVINRIGLHPTPFVSAGVVKQHHHHHPHTAQQLSVKPSAPPVPVARKPQVVKCRALFEFAAEQSGDLAFIKGDMIEVMRQNGDWWEGRNLRTNCEGQFPNNYVQMI